MPTPPAVARCTIATVLSAGSISVPLNNDDETADAVSVPPLALVALYSTMPNKPLGRTSRTDALVRILGSALRTIKVSEVVCPSIRTVGVAVFVMLKSACGPILTAAVPALLPVLVAVVPAGDAMVERWWRCLITAPTVPATACKTTVSVLATGSAAVPLIAELLVPWLVSTAPLALNSTQKRVFAYWQAICHSA